MEPKHKAEREVEAVVKWCEKQYHVMRKRKPRVPVETTLQIPTRAFYILENGSGKIEKSDKTIEEINTKNNLSLILHQSPYWSSPSRRPFRRRRRR